MKQVVSCEVYYVHFLWLELESTGDTSIKQVHIWNVLRQITSCMARRAPRITGYGLFNKPIYILDWPEKSVVVLKKVSMALILDFFYHKLRKRSIQHAPKGPRNNSERVVLAVVPDTFYEDTFDLESTSKSPFPLWAFNKLIDNLHGLLVFVCFALHMISCHGVLKYWALCFWLLM